MTVAPDPEPAVDVLHRALRELGTPARATVELSTFGRPPRRRGAFRVELDDGRTVKARVFLDAPAAARVAALQDALVGAALPRRLARHGRVTIETWVEGEPCAPDASGPDLLDDAARLLADLHRRRVPGAPPGPAVVDALEAGARERVAALRAGGVLDARRATMLAGALAQRPADPGPTGAVHGDFCAANLVRARDGRLVVVDNELLDLGPTDYDLGMTWYRWPLAARDVERFEGAYAVHAGRAPSGTPFFRAVALAKGLWVRWRLDPDTLPVALRRVDALPVP